MESLHSVPVRGAGPTNVAEREERGQEAAKDEHALDVRAQVIFYFINVPCQPQGTHTVSINQPFRQIKYNLLVNLQAVLVIEVQALESGAFNTGIGGFQLVAPNLDLVGVRKEVGVRADVRAW
jgi:hypothetical protein